MIIGHKNLIADLRSLAERGTLSHGYIFHGPSMVGKKTAAIAFANFLERGEFEATLNEDGTERVLSDCMVISPGENGSIGIDAVREIRNFLWQKPNVSARRTLIIDEAELLTTEAQNALLKITEEPPESSLLILVTSDIESILPTISSRLPKLYFGTVAEVKEKKAMGKPGLAWRLLNDLDFQERIALAEKLLKTPATTRRDLIKKIIEPDEFNFRQFLDALVVVLAWYVAGMQSTKADPQKANALWHRALQLYDRETNFSLNPRLQLESLLS